MSSIHSSRHVLAVKNLENSSSFYIEKLGFKSIWNGSGWHFLSRDNISIMLGECPDDQSAFETNNHSYFAYFDVSGLDELFEEFSAARVEILALPEDKPWGQREFAIRTIDGHRIMLGEELSSMTKE